MLLPQSGSIVSATLMGGLGNRLFAVAAAIGYGEKHGREAVICSKHNQVDTQRGREDYSDTVLSLIRKVHSLPDDVFNERPEDAFTYNPIPASKAKHYHLHGYFQDSRYFAASAAKLKNSLCLPTQTETVNTAFVHIRRADYLKYDVHNIDLYSVYLPNAIQLMKAKLPGVKFKIFSDDPVWCRNNLGATLAQAEFSEEKDAVQALTQMSACSAGGICWNSSYSWWGAYLGYRPGKVIIFPDAWFRDPSYTVTIQFPGSITMAVHDR